jgi:hypothetical protein
MKNDKVERLARLSELGDADAQARLRRTMFREHLGFDDSFVGDVQRAIQGARRFLWEARRGHADAVLAFLESKKESKTREGLAIPPHYKLRRFLGDGYVRDLYMPNPEQAYLQQPENRTLRHITQQDISPQARLFFFYDVWMLHRLGKVKIITGSRACGSPGCRSRKTPRIRMTHNRLFLVESATVTMLLPTLDMNLMRRMAVAKIMQEVDDRPDGGDWVGSAMRLMDDSFGHIFQLPIPLEADEFSADFSMDDIRTNLTAALADHLPEEELAEPDLQEGEPS